MHHKQHLLHTAHLNGYSAKSFNKPLLTLIQIKVHSEQSALSTELPTALHSMLIIELNSTFGFTIHTALQTTLLTILLNNLYTMLHIMLHNAQHHITLQCTLNYTILCELHTALR